MIGNNSVEKFLTPLPLLTACSDRMTLTNKRVEGKEVRLTNLSNIKNAQYRLLNSNNSKKSSSLKHVQK